MESGDAWDESVELRAVVKVLEILNWRDDDKLSFEEIKVSM